MLAEALGGDGGRIAKFRRDGWARPWPVGPEMLCYMLAHEAHHRGQVSMLAHQLGFPLPNQHGLSIEAGKINSSRPRLKPESCQRRATNENFFTA